MNFPPKMLNRQRSQISLSQSPAGNRLRLKLTTLISQHDLMKIAYQQLKSEIKSGLLEAEEVFTSLSIPLMKMVGLKTAEMAEEGRFTTIVIDTDSPQELRRNDVVYGSESKISPLSVKKEEQTNKVEVVNSATEATMAGKELVENQQAKLIQLVHMLRKIETQVNSRQNDILQTLACHRVSLHKIFLKVMCSLSNLHSQNRDTYFVTLKLLRAIFDFMGSVFGSVENGVDELIENLAEHMCNPMVEYVKGLKADMKFGTCARLLAVVEEMDIAVKNGRIELEEARVRVRVAEEGKIEALCKLKEAEERVRRMSERVRFLPEAKTESRESCVLQKVLGVEEDQDKDDNLLWELLKKRRYKAPESPMGPGGLLCFEPNGKRHKSTREVRPMLANRPITRSRMNALSGLLGPQTPCKDSRIPLGSSPSAAIQKVVSRKRTNP
ncbi:hypothetical protein Patl1_01328 [Pistacia atlantica]|uniref:Uncharacterized protein n=1 Tax=Pistacia atlantica TaxID=434234 RepID=A0ACC1C5X2_9ROSI|nr:hypothetical protein Patl1_01328 [Pistacia atlantica]